MIRSKELTDKILELDAGDDLEVKLEPRISNGSSERGGDILVERVKTPDYIRVTRIYDVRGANEYANRIHRQSKRHDNLATNTVPRTTE